MGALTVVGKRYALSLSEPRLISSCAWFPRSRRTRFVAIFFGAPGAQAYGRVRFSGERLAWQRRETYPACRTYQ